jgi:mannitol/fructose-specific phosphotransferase system IIA component (Ntr-type)
MLISEHLTEEAIALNLKGETMTEVLGELSRLIAAPNADLDAESVREDLVQREKLLSTASGCGIAFPHCYSSIKQPRFAIGISRKGIEAEAPDDKPVHIFLVVVSPEHNPNAHLEALSAASKVFLKAEVRDRVHTAESPGEVLDIIREAERNHG